MNRLRVCQRFGCLDVLGIQPRRYPEVTPIDIRAEQIGSRAVRATQQLIRCFHRAGTSNVFALVEPRLLEEMSVADLTGPQKRAK